MIVNQLISALFAFFVAMHDAPAVSSFERNDAPGPWMAKFHRYNFWLKAAFCFGISITYLPDWIGSASAGVFSALWIYLVFDPVLAVSREPARKWHYKGLNDSDGRFWNKWGGGKVKAVVLILAIVAANIIYQTVLL